MDNVLNPFLMNLGLHPVFNPFEVKKERKKIVRDTRGKSVMIVLDMIKMYPGITCNEISEKLNICDSHSQRITNMLEKEGKVVREYLGKANLPRRWYPCF